MGIVKKFKLGNGGSVIDLKVMCQNWDTRVKENRNTGLSGNKENKSYNAIINFFDTKDSNGNKTPDGRVSARNDRYFDEFRAVFKALDEYIKDGVLEDGEIECFLRKHDELKEVSVSDFKRFLTGEELSDTPDEEFVEDEPLICMSSKWVGVRGEAGHTEEALQEPVSLNITNKKKTYYDENGLKIERVCREAGDTLISESFLYYDQHGQVSSSKAVYVDNCEYIEKVGASGNSFLAINTVRASEGFFENGKLTRIEETVYESSSLKYDSTKPMLKLTYHIDEEGKIEYAERIEYLDGKEYLEKINYIDGKISCSVKYLLEGGEEIEISTSRYSTGKATLNFTNPDDGNEIKEIESDISVIETVFADGTISVTNALAIDDTGHYTDEAFMDRTTRTSDGKIVTVKKEFIIVDDAGNFAEQISRTVLDEGNQYYSATLYNTASITDYDDNETVVHRTYHKVVEGDKEHEVYYDGRGNTIIFLQHGECYNKIKTTFKPVNMQEDYFENKFKIVLNPGLNWVVGTPVLVPGEFNANDDKLTRRDTPEKAVQNYTEWFCEQLAHSVNTSRWKPYTLTENFSGVHDFARSLLDSEIYSADEINTYAWELVILNGNPSSGNNWLQAGSTINIPSQFEKLSKGDLNKFNKLGISTDNPKYHQFFYHFIGLESSKKMEVLNFIEKYRKDKNITGDFTDDQFEDLKRAILQKCGVCLTNSGLYVQDQASIYEGCLPDNEYTNEKFTLEDFIVNELGLTLTPGSVGHKIYIRFCCLDQEMMSRLPFGALLDEIKSWRKEDITCENIMNLVEDITLGCISIRFDDNGNFDKEGFEARAKQPMENPPRIIRDLFKNISEMALKELSSQVDALAKSSSGVQDACNWIAERLEAACDIDTDNLEDCYQAKSADQRLIDLFATNPAKAFKALTGYDFTYENALKFLNGEIHLSLELSGALEAYAENMETYAIIESVCVAITSVLVTLWCPFSVGAGASLLLRGAAFLANSAVGAAVTGGITAGVDMVGHFCDSIEEFSWKKVGDAFVDGARVGGTMYLGNGIGSVSFRFLGRLFPNAIKITSGTSFKTLAFGNTYAGSLAQRGLCYFGESVVQNGATVALYGEDVLDYKNYIFCGAATVQAVKWSNMLKISKTSKVNKAMTKLSSYSQKIIRGTAITNSVRQSLKALSANLDKATAELTKSIEELQECMDDIAICQNAGKGISQDCINNYNAAVENVKNTLMKYKAARDRLLSRLAVQKNDDFLGYIDNVKNLDENVESLCKGVDKDFEEFAEKTVSYEIMQANRLSNLSLSYEYNNNDLASIVENLFDPNPYINQNQTSLFKKVLTRFIDGFGDFCGNIDTKTSIEFLQNCDDSELEIKGLTLYDLLLNSEAMQEFQARVNLTEEEKRNLNLFNQFVFSVDGTDSKTGIRSIMFSINDDVISFDNNKRTRVQELIDSYDGTENSRIYIEQELYSLGIELMFVGDSGEMSEYIEENQIVEEQLRELKTITA